MVHVISTEVEINRAPSQVRAVFLDFSQWPQWHPGVVIKRASTTKADIEQGDKLNVGAGGMGFNPIVNENSDVQFSWVGSGYGLVSGEHCFRFEASKKTPGGTRFVQSETFAGFLSFLASPSFFMEKQRQQFDIFNQRLKKKVESE